MFTGSEFFQLSDRPLIPTRFYTKFAHEFANYQKPKGKRLHLGLLSSQGKRLHKHLLSIG
jgi:hypothetical protein